MSYRLSVDVIGARELDEAFRRAPQTAARELGRGLMKTAFAVERRAKQNAPIEHGTLRGSINTQGPTTKGNNVEAIVGTNVRYARWQEEGTGIYGPRKQPIRPTNAKMLVWKSGGQLFFARSVKGVKPKRYFRQAKEESVTDLTENMRAALAAIVRELAA